MVFNVGDKVIDKSSNQLGEITGNKQSSPITGIKYEVCFGDGRLVFIRDSILEKVVKPLTPEEKFDRGEGFLDFTEYRQYMTFLRMKGQFTNIFYSMKQGNIKFFPYQMKPMIKFISSIDRRLLIADEVGLGKTIETLLIWKELVARDDANRILVVVPAMLRDKWQHDMKYFFGIDAEIVGADELLKRLKYEDENPGKGFALITSIQGIHYGELKPDAKASSAHNLNNYLEKYRENHPAKKLIDLVVFDEAHYLVHKQTANNKTATRLNEVSEGMLLLSATPINGKTDELFNLLVLLSPDKFFNKKEFDSEYDRNKKLVRLAHLFHGVPSKTEVEKRKAEVRSLLKDIRKDPYYSADTFYGKVEDELDFVFDGTEEGHHRRLELYDEVVQRYFYSDVFTRSKKTDVLEHVAQRTPHVVKFELSKEEKAVYDRATLELQLKLLEKEEDRFWTFCILSRQREMASCIPAAIARWKEKGNIILDEEEKEEYELEFDDESKSSVSSSTFPCVAGIDTTFLERQDSKFNHFLGALQKKLDEGEKVIVFSFFRGTLKYLERRLNENGIKTALILGGMKSEEKNKQLEVFKESQRVNVLLSSEVGAEGIDLQFARIEINYDLPWNPMRLEQRIGRIDRIGQESDKIFIINMCCSNTVEDQVLDTLYSKINVCEQAIGEIDEVLGEETSQIQLELLKSEKTDEEKLKEQENEINRIARALIDKKKLEENIGLTKSYNDRLIDYVNSAETNHRYLKDEDYQYYIEDFLSRYGNGSTLEKSLTEGLWELRLSDKDKEDFRAFLDRNGSKEHIPQGAYISCSFPSCKISTATWKIDVSHQLIKWINSIIDEKHKNADCYIFHVPSSSIDKSKELNDNAYVFYVCSFEFLGGLKKKDELISEAVGVHSKEVLSRDDADYLLSNAIYYGTTAGAKALDMATIGEARIDAMKLCKEEYQKVEDAILQDLLEKNEVSCVQSIQRINSIYSKRDLDLKDKYENAVKAGFKTVAADEGKIRKNKARWDEALKAIEAKSHPDSRMIQKALGLVIID